MMKEGWEGRTGYEWRSHISHVICERPLSSVPQKGAEGSVASPVLYYWFGDFRGSKISRKVLVSRSRRMDDLEENILFEMKCRVRNKADPSLPTLFISGNSAQLTPDILSLKSS